jgi:CheY-like chemotaxis protein
VTPSETTAPVLIVEDDEPTQKLLQALLHRAGYTTEIAANGGQAISLLRGGAYAVVVLDLMMPTVGGREVVDFLVAEGKTVPVVICSAAGTAALSGFDLDIVKAVVRKPFDLDQFVAAIRDAVGSH